jgi:hypothetical protein
MHKRFFANFESSWLKIFALHKVEALYIVLGNRVGNPKKNSKIQKNLCFNSLKAHQIGESMCKRKSLNC